MPVVGAHVLLYSPRAGELRAALRELLGTREVDAGGDWPIWELPPAEIAVHPSDGATHHELSLVCRDVRATVEELRGRGAEFRGEPEDLGFGVGLTMLLPGGVEVLLYEPRYEPAFSPG